MGSLNQFKLINQKCEKYYNLLEKELNKELELKNPKDKYRFGFYLYILECVTNIKEIDQLIEMITDTEFNKTVFSNSFNDQGIDAVYIDDENQEIDLFNFKYSEKFRTNQQSLNNVFVSTKFTTALVNFDSSNIKDKIKKYADEIIKNLQSNEIWKLNLYMVSNESIGLKEDDPTIKQLKELYDLDVKSITLNDISNFMSKRPKPISAKIVIDNDAILSYTETLLSSSKSYIIRISIPELIRITCTDPQLRDNYSFEDISKLSDSKLDFAVLFDNVRGFLGRTKYNDNIIQTLKNDPSKFFMYNNVITITADRIEAKTINVKKKMKIEIENLQIVNGGQTLRAIYEFNKSNKDAIQKYLLDGEILIRIFKTSNEPKLTNKIAEYTNSQNAISVIDLKSLAYEQLEIEKFLDDHKIIYARKVGDTGTSSDKDYDYYISLEKFGQILFSINGNPEKASNQKKRIFDKHYNETFGEENFDFNNSAKIVEEYYKIKEIYNTKFKNIDITDQKIFYILYLNRKRKKYIASNINFLEKCISEYRSDDELPSARKLIQKSFKQYMDSKIK
ncbi:MAG: AIPR family protein [Candidatus Cloacimonetes bacterium]|nr:AIPR family protein [Candidatus Cloacimonadota bacterium]